MVERQLPKLNVAGSIPVSRSKKCTTYSLELVDLGVLKHFELRLNIVKRGSKLFRRRRPACDQRLTESALTDVEGVSTLVGNRLPVNPESAP